MCFTWFNDIIVSGYLLVSNISHDYNIFWWF